MTSFCTIAIVGTALVSCGTASPTMTTPAPEARPGSESTRSVASAPARPEAASWERRRLADEDWYVRTPGLVAAPLVLRGDTGPGDVAVEGGACATSVDTSTPLRSKVIRLLIEGEKRGLRLSVMARGRLAVRVGGDSTCVVASAAHRVSLDLEPTQGPIEVTIDDAVPPGERRGQRVPFAVVVSDDAATARFEEPDPKQALGPSDVTVHYAVVGAPCANDDSERHFWRCYRGTVELGGAVRKSLRIPVAMDAQASCRPFGVGVICSGASRQTVFTLTLGDNGALTLEAASASDGYCPKGDCVTRNVVLRSSLKPHLRLVPDPDGSFGVP